MSDFECPICLLPYTVDGDHRASALKCGHVFGHPCITASLSRVDPDAKSCPTCKSPATVDDVGLIYIDEAIVATTQLKAARVICGAVGLLVQTLEVAMTLVNRLDSDKKKLVTDLAVANESLENAKKNAQRMNLEATRNRAAHARKMGEMSEKLCAAHSAEMRDKKTKLKKLEKQCEKNAAELAEITASLRNEQRLNRELSEGNRQLSASLDQGRRAAGILPPLPPPMPWPQQQQFGGGLGIDFSSDYTDICPNYNSNNFHGNASSSSRNSNNQWHPYRRA